MAKTQKCNKIINVKLQKRSASGETRNAIFAKNDRRWIPN